MRPAPAILASFLVFALTAPADAQAPTAADIRTNTPTTEPQDQASRRPDGRPQEWVAYSEVGGRPSFSRRSGPGTDPREPKVGDVLQARSNVWIRPGIADRRRRIGTVKRGEEVIVQEVRARTAGRHTQFWMRIERLE